MRIDDLEWTLERVDHIAQHAVTPEEVEEVLSAAPSSSGAEMEFTKLGDKPNPGDSLRKVNLT